MVKDEAFCDGPKKGEYSLNTLGLKNTKVWQDFLTSLGFWEKMRRITRSGKMRLT